MTRHLDAYLRPAPWVCGLLLPGGLLLAGIAIGPMHLEGAQIWRGLLDPQAGLARIAVWELRLPRSLLAFWIGGVLALAGFLMQTVARNPLASPSLTGISAGGSLAVVAGSLLVKVPTAALPWLAWLGCLLAGALTLALAGLRRLVPGDVVLAGLAVTALCGALTSLLLVQAQADAGELLFWLAGGVAGRSWDHLTLLLAWALLPLLLLLLTLRPLWLLAGSDDSARSLGLDPGRWRLWFLLLASALAAPTVAVAGPVGFVGLLVPHLARRLGGRPGVASLALCLPLGGCLLLGADVLGRLLSRGQEVPIGILTALLGGPWLLRLLLRQGGRG